MLGRLLLIVLLSLLLGAFSKCISGYSGYKSAHAYRLTRVRHCRAYRVINKMATTLASAYVYMVENLLDSDEFFPFLDCVQVEGPLLHPIMSIVLLMYSQIKFRTAG